MAPPKLGEDGGLSIKLSRFGGCVLRRPRNRPRECLPSPAGALSLRQGKAGWVRWTQEPVPPLASPRPRVMPFRRARLLSGKAAPLADRWPSGELGLLPASCQGHSLPRAQWRRERRGFPQLWGPCGAWSQLLQDLTTDRGPEIGL